MKSHHIHPELLKHKVRVLVVGCGGNGSAVAAGLPYLHQALLACGHPEGLHVTLLDPDAISATNCVRQAFSQSEIGLYKSVVLANRLIMFWGLDWEGIPERLDPKRRLDGVDIVIGCVDTRKARAAIAKCAEDWSEVDYWLDLGNNADGGQFVLGEPLIGGTGGTDSGCGPYANSFRRVYGLTLTETTSPAAVRPKRSTGRNRS